MGLQQRYVVRRLISRGSFGAVYEVDDARFTGQRRALKELVPVAMNVQEFEESRRWFLREGEILGELNHPAIPRIWDSFEQQSRLYIVMQYIEGSTLEATLQTQPGKGLPAEQVLDWAAALCDVLEYLHGHQPPVVFRDLKPDNIMIESSGRLMLIDFGIATRFAPQRIGTTIGTPGYAPPEQYQGLSEPRSDLYALGATLHHLLTGRDPTEQPPFSFPPLDPGALRISPALARMIDRSLSFILSERPASIVEFRQALFARSGSRPALSMSGTRYDLRQASKLASKNWSAAQRALLEARLPRQLEVLRRQVEAGAAMVPASDSEEQARELQALALRREATRLEGSGHFTRAVSTLDQALQLLPGALDLLLDKARILRQAGKLAEAAEVYRQALQEDADQPGILAGMGWCLAHSGQHQEALGVLEKAITLDPLNTEAWTARGWSLACQQRLHEALLALEEATAIDPFNAEAWRTSGWCLERLGQENDALRAFKQAQHAG
jgi:tetratricopeptide (TPR) repeat protein